MSSNAGTRRGWTLAASAALLAAAAGCGDPALPGAEALEAIPAGTPQAEVMEALPRGPLPERATALNGHPFDSYFTGGAAVSVVWVLPRGGLEPGADPRRTANPVLFRDGVLDGWGWDHFDARAGEWGLRPIEAPENPTPPTPRELPDEGQSAERAPPEEGAPTERRSGAG